MVPLKADGTAVGPLLGEEKVSATRRDLGSVGGDLFSVGEESHSMLK